MLGVRGEVTAVSDGVTVRVRGDGPRLLVEIDGRLPASRRTVAEASRRLGESGLDASVTDRRGRHLATAGASVRSPLGRILTGSSSVRPTLRGIARAVRNRTRKGTRNA